MKNRVDFNTSHVTVYQEKQECCDQRSLISIHLMLLFIDSNQFVHLLHFLFQYISCYCLSRKYSGKDFAKVHFNTSHVTVYRDNCSNATYFSIFQYISCYCLSLQTGAKCARCTNFNTSHVTVYPVEDPRSKELAHFNTSHVTVYQNHHRAETVGTPYFNTSHVTVYQERIKASYREGIFQYISCYCLSSSAHTFCDPFTKFQYISCYCLSRAIQAYVKGHKIISIHLMLLFILSGFRRMSGKENISIHLMLLFILKEWQRVLKKRHFNTSHVTVYRI